MSRLRYSFLINPVSGGGEGKRVMQQLPEILGSMGFSAEQWKAEFSERDGFHSQVALALSGAERVVAVGGDGTMNAVLSVLAEKPRNDVRVGLVPLGTGNDLARVLGLYEPYVNRGLLYLLRRMLGASSCPFDLWRVNGRHVLANYCSAGIDARIAHDFNKDRSEGRIPGTSVIANKTHYVKAFWKDRNHRISKGTLRWQDRSGEWLSRGLAGCRTILIGNIPSFAGGANPFLDSNMADGLLEVVPVPNLFRFLGTIATAPAAGASRWFNQVWQPTFHAKEVVLELGEGEYLQLDGEDFSGKLGGEVRITYACQAQLLMLPKGL